MHPFADYQERTSRTESAKCRCGRATREGKPWCPRHLRDSPYVQGVLEDMRRHQLEERGARVDLEGIAANDVLVAIREHGGVVSWGRLRRATKCTDGHLRRVVNALRRAGLVEYAKGSRGQQAVVAA